MVNAVQMEAKNKTEHVEDKNIEVHFTNGVGYWSEEIGHEKIIDGSLIIASPAEGSWDIKFEEGDQPEKPENTFYEQDKVKRNQDISIYRHRMERKRLILNFKSNENRNETVKANLHLNFN